MEGIAEAGLFAFFGSEGFDGLQIEVICAQRILAFKKGLQFGIELTVQMQIRQILSVDKQVQHIKPLPTNL